MSELSDVISEMRNMRESYNQIGAAAEAYNTGKTELAANITAKGVQASATETLPELAQKVGIIAQTETILEGGEVMAAQQFGDGALWNLYQVLADMKTRFMGTGDYAALIVCEYYKGYDSLVLQGADGYYTCDGDYYDYASPTHVWHDADNGKMNRWVAFLYRDEGARLDITNTAISPRSMYIGGHIGTIEYFVNGRLTELVCGVEETDVVDNFLPKNFTQAWEANVSLKNVGISGGQSADSGLFANQLLFYCDCGKSVSVARMDIRAQYIKFNSLEYLLIDDYNARFSIVNAIIAEFPQLKWNGLRYSDFKASNNLMRLYCPNLIRTNSTILISNCSNLIDVTVGEAVGNLNFQGWNPTNVLSDATKKAQLIENIKNHILARVSDATGGTQLVFTISTNMYNNIASEQIEWQGETMSLADAFLTKNWLLAGA